MSLKTKRHTTGAACLLGLVLGGLLLAQAHSVRADHTGRLTLQSVQDHVDDLGEALDAMCSEPASCGNGIGEFGELCDGTQFADGLTCQSEGFNFGSLACDDSCRLDTSGCFDRFEDLGVTVCDYETGLEWEKKTVDGTVHDTDNRYTWSLGGSFPTGTAYTVFLAGLGDFAGGDACTSTSSCTSSNGETVSCTRDPPVGCWRLPENDELGTILDCSFSPCIDPIFGPTASSFHWSASSFAGDPNRAWGALFNNGNVGFNFKTDNKHVRAVRAGSCN